MFFFNNKYIFLKKKFLVRYFFIFILELVRTDKFQIIIFLHKFFLGNK